MSTQRLAKRPRKSATDNGPPKNHKFESFSQRIARFKVDPLRRGDRHRAITDEEGSSSYFRTSLEEWRESNLTENFTKFAEEVDPLSNNLVQILHHKDAIHTLLLQKLRKEDALSLEPLLSLVAHFAHDLGARFEPYFQETVSTVALIAAKHDNVEVIEWSFNCLAWLFKYLARLLVPDLRPLFTLMEPYLGRERQKTFVTRFAAEALSYLVRKAASTKGDGESFYKLIVHIEDSLVQCPHSQAEQYGQGLANLFGDSIKGIQRGLHSSGPAILKALASAAIKQSNGISQRHSGLQHITEMVLVNTIHNTDAKGFEPGFDTLLQVLGNSIRSETSDRFLFLLVATRKGTRVSNWSRIIGMLEQSVLNLAEDDTVPTCRSLPLPAVTSACVLQFAPLEIAGLQMRDVIAKWLTPELWHYFLPLCILTSDLGEERFDSLLKPDFQKFVVMNWASEDASLYALLPQLRSQLRGLSIPSQLQEATSARLNTLSEQSGTDLLNSEILDSFAIVNSALDVISSFRGEIDVVISRPLQRLIQEGLGRVRHFSNADVYSSFALGKGLLTLASSLGESRLEQVLALHDVFAASKWLQYSVDYLRAILTLCRGLSSSALSDHIKLNNEEAGLGCDLFIQALIENLSSSSKDLRCTSLKVLVELCRKHDQLKEDTDLLELALMIEGLPLTPESARQISGYIKSIGARYATASTSKTIRLAMPAYIFGVFHLRLTSAWNEACSALEVMSHVKGTDGLIMDRVYSWLTQNENSQGVAEDAEDFKRPLGTQFVTPWQCSNVQQVETKVVHLSKILQDPMTALRKTLDSTTKLQTTEDRTNRSQALKILNSLPQVAEKRSRMIVPLFLRMLHLADETTGIAQALDLNEDLIQNGNEDSPISNSGWPKKDQLAFMTLFSKFVNPSVLFRSEDVHHALMSQLCVGDSDTQRSALKAIFAWKHRYVKPYEENLLNILDVNMFREELSVFLSGEDVEGVIHYDHRTQLMPIVVRLLYGRAITRSKSLSHGRGQAGLRKSVLHTLARFRDTDIDEFLGIMLGPLDRLNLFEPAQTGEIFARTLLSPRKQMGLLRMTEDVLIVLANRVDSFIPRIAEAILYCAVHSTTKINAGGEPADIDETEKSELNVLKSCRQCAISCLDKLFRISPEHGWQPYLSTIFDKLITPRLDNLPVENSQGVSAMLKLFATWASSPIMRHLLLEYNESLLVRIADCLVETSAQPEVLIFVVVKIIYAFITAGDESPSTKPLITEIIDQRLRDKLADCFIIRITKLLARSSDKQLIESCVRVVIRLHEYITNANETSDIIKASLQLLDRPAKEISPKLKSQVLEMLGRFVTRYDFEEDQALRDQAYKTLAALFSYFQDATSRQKLCSTFASLCLPEPTLLVIAELCQSLNAFRSSRLSEPDFEKRLQAFRSINEDLYSSLTPVRWLPIIHNALFLIKDDFELAMRTSASFCLKRFITVSRNEIAASEYTELVTHTFVPALEKGMKEPSELVRTEYVSVLAEAVRTNSFGFEDMKILLGPDDESSFFNNILHIQQHRRTRALRRLGEQFKSIGSVSLYKFCIPLVEQYLASGDEVDSNLGMEAVHCLEQICCGLEWQRFRALLHKLGVRLTPQSSRLSIRALSALVSSLHQSTGRAKLSKLTELNTDQSYTALERTLPDKTVLAATLTKTLLPKLMEIVHYADESTIDTRVLIAPAAVKVMLTFTDEEISARLPALLIDLCNILKARAQESRDSARKVLTEISSLIGPQYFGFVLKQLRNSLQRGYQLHVLAYTVHSILVPLSARFKFGELDYCLDMFMDIIIDEIFGVVGQEKESEDFISRMKEVKKKNLSYDSLEILASISSITAMSQLILPLKAQLNKPRPRVEKVDESLRRIREGLRRNQEASTEEALTLCFELMHGAQESKNENPSPFSTKLSVFGTDLLRRIIDKHEELKTAEYMAGFVPVLVDGIKSDDDELRSSAMRCVSSMIKLDLELLDNTAPDLLRIAKATIERSPSTNTPIAQTAIRLASSILRERSNAVMKQSFFETHIAYVLARIKPDLRDPAHQSDRDRQVAAFNFIRAVMSRGILLKEIYEVMDVIREVMVSNRENPIPELSRSVYSRFLLEYFPEQGKGLRKQLDFLVANLQYPRSEGRQSVMEVMMFLISKKNEETVQPVLTTFFLPLLLIIGADETTTCRDYARLILHKIFERADKEKTKTFKSQLLKWLEPETEPIWQRISFTCWDIFVGVHLQSTKQVDVVFNAASKSIEQATTQNLHKDKERAALLDSVLQLLKRGCDIFPGIAFASEHSQIWTDITSLIASAPPPLKLPLVNLTTAYLTHFARHTVSSSSKDSTPSPLTLPLTGPYGLVLTDSEAWALAETHLEALSSDTTAHLAELVTACIQNISFLARISSSETGSHLLSYASEQIKREDESVSHSAQTRLNALTLLTSLTKQLPTTTITESLSDILTPLSTLTDTSIPHSNPSLPTEKNAYDTLLTNAHELLSLLQTKLGTTTFIETMATVQKAAREKREERKRKRDVDKVANPESAERKRNKKHESSKHRRKERNSQAAAIRRGW